jgi:hypothetical protein
MAPRPNEQNGASLGKEAAFIGRISTKTSVSRVCWRAGCRRRALSRWSVGWNTENMENLDDDEQAWERIFRDNQDHFSSLAQEALDEHRRGETRPIEELLGE